jgi:hypothetical protein
MEQLMANGVVPGDPDSVAKTFADLKAKLEKKRLLEKQHKLRLTH